jgi:hypothetical protein
VSSFILAPSISSGRLDLEILTRGDFGHGLVVSDKYGRKPVLLLTMLGNILSAFIWLKSTTFVSISPSPVFSFRSTRLFS